MVPLQCCKIVRCFHCKVAESLGKNNYLVGHIPYTVKIINNIKRLADWLWLYSSINCHQSDLNHFCLQPKTITRHVKGPPMTFNYKCLEQQHFTWDTMPIFGIDRSGNKRLLLDEWWGLSWDGMFTAMLVTGDCWKKNKFNIMLGS